MTLHGPPGGGEPGPPATLEDPIWLATGAMVATLLAHRREWVRGHIETIEPRGSGLLRRRVTIEFELPGGARASAPGSGVAAVPLGLIPKDSPTASIAVRNGSGAEVARYPESWSAELAAAGLVAIARSAGADAGADMRRLAWSIAAGSQEEARAALAQLARGDSADARLLWSHAPFRVLAQMLAEHAVVLVPAQSPERRRTIEYAYDERAEEAPSGKEPGIYGRLARRFRWGGLRISAPVAPLADARTGELDVDGGPGVQVTAEPDASGDAIEIRLTARHARVVRLAPVVGVLTALVLTVAWLLVPRLADDPRALPIVLAVPAVLAALVAARPGSAVLGELLGGVRRLLLAAGATCLAAEIVLATGASAPVLRVGSGLAALAAWVVALLLLETRRRILGGRPPSLPERFRPARPHVAAEDHGNRTRLALVACAMAAGLLIVAFADNLARDGEAGARTLLWVGLLVIFVPAVVHAWHRPSRLDSLLVVVFLGVALYLVKVLNSPIGFTQHDEFSTLRTVLDIDRFGHVFHHNPLIAVHPFYPAIELVTSAVATVTGLSTFTSAMVVIGVLRVALMVALFLVFEAASSTRVAVLATVLYACNPNFVFFDAQWAYESFALPFALLAIAIVARGRRGAWMAVPIVITLCIAHPLTTMALIAFLLVWAAIDAAMARREGRKPRRELWMLALFGAACMLVWAALVARTLGGYLGPVVGDAGNSLVDLLLGESGPKRIFGAAGVEQTAVVERLLGFGAVLLALAALAFGARPLWQRFTALGGALGLAALIYPLSLPLRLTEAGTEISNRASEFVFVGVAFLAALALDSLSSRMAWRAKGRRLRLLTPLVATLAAVGLVGGVVIGTAPSSRLPGRYLVISDPRSVEPEGIEAARWARSELGTGNRVVTDRANGLLMGSIGLQEPQVGEILGRPVPNVITSPDVNADVRLTLIADKIGYLVVDRRISTALPGVGFYFEREEPGAYQHKRPPSLAALLKYDAVCSIGRAFDSGNIVMYDTRRAGDTAPCAAAPGKAP